MIGYFNFWAAIFFVARTLEFNMHYFAPDFIIAAAYTVRVVYFFMMVRNETQQAKEDFFTVYKWSTFGLVTGGILFTTLSWIEWQVPPVYSIGSWITIGGINAYHWFVIKSYAGISVGSFQSYTKEVEESTGEDTTTEQFTDFKRTLKSASVEETPMIVILK